MDFPTLNAIRTGDAAKVGNKAAQLGELCHLGLLVPEGFVLPTKCFKRYRLESELPFKNSSIGENLHELNSHGEMAQQILSRFDEEGLDVVSVRSSSTFEDSFKNSFAGLFATTLGVKRADLFEAIVHCWESVDRLEVINYCHERQLNPRQIEMAVIVQRQINARISGVCFTRNPVSGNSSESYIETVLGLGEGLVGGSITPSSYFYDRVQRTVRKKDVRSQKEAILLHGQGVRRVTLDNELAHAAEIPDEMVRKISDDCARIEEHFGSAQDVEFCVQGETIYYLQARAITS